MHATASSSSRAVGTLPASSLIWAWPMPAARRCCQTTAQQPRCAAGASAARLTGPEMAARCCRTAAAAARAAAAAATPACPQAYSSDSQHDQPRSELSTRRCERSGCWRRNALQSQCQATELRWSYHLVCCMAAAWLKFGQVGLVFFHCSLLTASTPIGAQKDSSAAEASTHTQPCSL